MRKLNCRFHFRNRSLFLMGYVLVIALTMFSCGNQGIYKDMELVWSEEFDYEGLPDSSNWNIVVGKSRVNNEPQWYTDNPQNLWVSDGMLKITAKIEEVDGENRYTSGRINSMDKFEFHLGRAEARLKLPQGRGVWPAFWALGKVGRWPVCGEIDIMEFWGHDPNVIGANVHTGDYNHTKGNGRGGEYTYTDPWADFHLYAVEWFEDRLDFYFDDVLYYSCPKKGEGIGEWPFDEPEYLIVNFALWNNWGEGVEGIDDSIFPQEYLVDYIRVYKFKE